jgi:hypothetical protein
MFLQFVAGRAETIQRDQPADDIPGGCDFVCRRARSAGRVFAVHGESEAVDEFTRWEGPDPEKGGCRRDAGAQRGDFEDGLRTDSRDRHAVPGEFCAARTAARSVGPFGEAGLRSAQALSREFQWAYRDIHDLIRRLPSAGKLAKLLSSWTPPQQTE